MSLHHAESCTLPCSFSLSVFFFFFFNDTATTEIYTLSLHDALPISPARRPRPTSCWCRAASRPRRRPRSEEHTSELQSPCNLVCRLLLEKKKMGTLRTGIQADQGRTVRASFRLASTPTTTTLLA